jgi:hypothetical protein
MHSPQCCFMVTGAALCVISDLLTMHDPSNVTDAECSNRLDCLGFGFQSGHFGVSMVRCPIAATVNSSGEVKCVRIGHTRNWKWAAIKEGQ